MTDRLRVHIQTSLVTAALVTTQIHGVDSEILTQFLHVICEQFQIKELTGICKGDVQIYCVYSILYYLLSIYREVENHRYKLFQVHKVIFMELRLKHACNLIPFDPFSTSIVNIRSTINNILSLPEFKP